MRGGFVYFYSFPENVLARDLYVVQPDCKFRIMPLLTLKELESMSPVFQGSMGNALGRTLMRWLAVDKVNDLYDENSAYAGPDFTGNVLEDIGVHYDVMGMENLNILPDGPFITISNHPYGSIDGVMLVDLFGRLRPDYKVMVNGFLSRIETLKDNFICVTPTGNERTAPTKESLHGIKEAIEHVRAGHPLGIFPSGAVSDLSLKDRCIRDRQWQEPVIRLIKKLHVPVLPVKFMDRNSDFYYSLGLIDWRVRLLRLPSEVFNKRGKLTRIRINKPVSPQEQDEYSDIEKFSAFLRSTIY